jgi:hypothetical protein
VCLGCFGCRGFYFLRQTGLVWHHGPMLERFFDWQVWLRGAEVVMNAPQVVFSLLAIVAFVAYWFRGKLAESSISGLREQNSGVREKNDVLGPVYNHSRRPIHKPAKF